MPTALVVEGSGGPALATVRSLGRAGWRVLVPEASSLRRSRFAADTVPLADAAAAPGLFVADVTAALAAESVDVLVPVGDATAELLWSLGDALGGARILGADAASFRLCSDKALTLAAADRAGFPTPDWCAPADAEEARDALERIGTPCVVKPRHSYTRAGERLVHRRHVVVSRPDELDAALEAGRDPDGSLPVLQSFVHGRSLAATAVVQEGRIVACAARETLSFHPIAGGTSVWKRTIPPDDVGVQKALGLLLAIGYEGVGEVEYQVDGDGVPRLMEIGVRAHGWVPLACAAGVDLPLLAARALLGERLAETTSYRVGVQMRWPGGELARLRDAFRPGAALPPGASRRGVLAKAWPVWAPGMRYDSVDLGDLRALLPLRAPRRRRPAVQGPAVPAEVGGAE